MTLSELVRFGATPMLPKVPPLLKPAMKAWLAPLAEAKMLVGSAGEERLLPPRVNRFDTGEFLEKLSTTVAGKESENIPMPPLMTVLLIGLQVNPKRGCQTIISVEG